MSQYRLRNPQVGSGGTPDAEAAAGCGVEVGGGAGLLDLGRPVRLGEVHRDGLLLLLEERLACGQSIKESLNHHHGAIGRRAMTSTGMGASSS